MKLVASVEDEDIFGLGLSTSNGSQLSFSEDFTLNCNDVVVTFMPYQKLKKEKTKKTKFCILPINR